MVVCDECGAVKHLQKLAQQDFTCEHCAIATAQIEDFAENLKCRINDFCMIQDVGGKTNEFASTIPNKVSYSLLDICKKKDQIPVILHTHIEGHDYSQPLKFSPQDMSFIEQFTKYAAKSTNIQACVFIVTNGKDIVYCLRTLNDMQYYFQKEINNE